MSKRASDDAADTLHALTFEVLTEEIGRYKRGEMFTLDRDGNKVVLPIPPALLAQAIKALKDNGIDTPAKAGNRVDTLKAAMPDFDQLEARSPLASH